MIITHTCHFGRKVDFFRTVWFLKCLETDDHVNRPLPLEVPLDLSDTVGKFSRRVHEV